MDFKNFTLSNFKFTLRQSLIDVAFGTLSEQLSELIPNNITSKI